MWTSLFAVTAVIAVALTMAAIVPQFTLEGDRTKGAEACAALAK